MKEKTWLYAVLLDYILTHLSATSCGNPISHWWGAMSNRNKCTAENLHTNLFNSHAYVHIIILINLSQYLFAKWWAQHFNRGLALWSTVSVRKYEQLLASKIHTVSGTIIIQNAYFWRVLSNRLVFTECMQTVENVPSSSIVSASSLPVNHKRTREVAMACTLRCALIGKELLSQHGQERVKV